MKKAFALNLQSPCRFVILRSSYATVASAIPAITRMKVTCRVIAALNPLDICYYLLLIFRSESVSRYESLGRYGRYDHHKSLRVITSLYEL